MPRTSSGGLRAALLRAFLLAASAATVGAAAVSQAAEPLMKRIKVATFTAPNLAEVESTYAKWLDQEVRERGRISSALASSWGAPKVAGRPYLLMSAEGHPDVYLRIVQAPAAKDYAPLTTYGWNAIEIIVDDPDGLRERLRPSPFRVIGEPAPLGAYPTIRAFQVVGTAGEVLYLTAETGDRSKSLLPLPKGAVGRTFIMVVAGPDIHALVDWYTSHFGLTAGQVRERTVGVLQRAQQLAPGQTLPLTTVRLAQHGNLIELDGYSKKAKPRETRKGELPPGVAMTSFGIGSFEALKVPLIAPPAVYEGAAYAGRRAATARGAAGELVELIEE